MSLSRRIGRLGHYLAYPLLVLYLHRSHRTRLLLICNDKLLVTKDWFGDGHWGLPGGGLHKNEVPLDGLIRETSEETGVRLDPLAVKELGTWRRNIGICYIMFHGFAAEIPSEVAARPQPGEIAEVAWVAISELTAQTAKPDVLEFLARWQAAPLSDKL